MNFYQGIFKNRKHILKILVYKKQISTVFILLAFAFLARNLYGLQNGIVVDLNVNIMFLILSILLVMPIYLVNGLSWYLVLRGCGVNFSYRDSLRIWVFSNIGRYIPGAVWQYMGRVYLTSNKGVPVSVALGSLIWEAFFVTYVGLAISSLTVLPYLFFKYNFLWGLNYVVFGILITVLLVFFKFQDEIFVILNKVAVMFNLPKIGKNSAINIRYLPFILFSFAAQYILGGTVLFLVSNIIWSVPINHLPMFVGIYASAWTFGYLFIFAPSGLGVQEVALAGFISFFVPLPIATVIAILFRIITIIGESITVGGLGFWKFLYGEKKK